ncbi:MAG TPA: hypothetical protein PLH11_09860 [Gemmobacter sp.]|nr:hypothetical protein [Gemmobacter sp.]
MTVGKVHPMFLRALSIRKAKPVSPPSLDETLAYYTREVPQGPLREVTALEQHYGYWSRE